MMTEKQFYFVDAVASPLFDFVEDFISCLDKVYALKELFYPNDSKVTIGDFKEIIYTAPLSHIYSIYSNMGNKCPIYNEFQYEYFEYALYRKHCYEEFGNVSSYDDYSYYQTKQSNINQCWDIFRRNEIEGKIMDFKWPFYFASLEDTNNYISNIIGVAKEIMKKMGETSSQENFINSIHNIFTKKLREETSDIIKEAEDLLRPIQNFITQKDYESIYDVTKAFYVFFENTCKNDEFLDFFNEVPDVKKFINSKTNLTEVIYLVFTNQICLCYKNLSHYPINIVSKEGAVIALWMQLHSASTNPSYENFISTMQNKYVTGALQKFITSISNSETIATINKTNLISTILSEMDTELQKQYLVLLYRVAFIIAKIDGDVTKEEAFWLSHLLDTSDKSSESLPLPTNKAEENTDYSNKLQELIGLDSVKSEVISLSNFIKMRQMRETHGLKVPQISLHCIFTGNPGTGKTTVARILAGIFKNLGVIRKGHLIETDRSGLVAEYVGQTAVKTNRIIDSALDGVLFIDEAYSLAQGDKNDYGREAISTLLKRMEDDRDRLIVILAGYSDEMQEFINSNPGLHSRFNRYIHFPDYSADDLYKIFSLNMKKNEYVISAESEQYLQGFLERIVANKTKDFGNARYIRNLFERVIENQANRLAIDSDISVNKLKTIEIDDIKQELKCKK